MGAKAKASARAAKRIVSLIRRGKAKWAGDVGLINPDPAKGKPELVEDIEFAYAKLDRANGRWRRKGFKGNNGSFAVTWGAKGVGFGEVTFFLDKRNRLHCASECMGRKFVKAALAKMVDGAVWDE